MNHSPFLKGLLLTSLISLIISFSLSLLPQEAPFQAIIFGSILFFGFFALLQYAIGIKTAKHPNKSLFIGMVQGLSGAKVVLTLTFIILFVRIAQPESDWFVLPFLLNYAIFTVFETMTMSRVGKEII